MKSVEKMAAIFEKLLKTVKAEKSGKEINFFDLARLGDEFHKLPFSIRILLESAVRNCDNFQVGNLTFLKFICNLFLIYKNHPI